MGIKTVHLFVFIRLWTSYGCIYTYIAVEHVPSRHSNKFEALGADKTQRLATEHRQFVRQTRD